MANLSRVLHTGHSGFRKFSFTQMLNFDSICNFGIFILHRRNMTGIFSPHVNRSQWFVKCKSLRFEQKLTISLRNRYTQPFISVEGQRIQISRRKVSNKQTASECDALCTQTYDDHTTNAVRSTSLRQIVLNWTIFHGPNSAVASSL